MSYSALIEANRTKAQAAPRTHACALCHIPTQHSAQFVTRAFR